MKDRKRADELDSMCAMYMVKYTAMADEIFESVAESLRG